MPSILPDKLYFKIGEVAEALQVRTSVLRFWESEFSFLKPGKGTTGQRLYTRREVELILQVKRLLYDEKYTIQGVKKKISARGKLIDQENLHEVPDAKSLTELVRKIRQELKELRDGL